jgi:hypothetical protein
VISRTVTGAFARSSTSMTPIVKIGHNRLPFIPNATLFLSDINGRNPPLMAEFPLILLQKQSDFDSPMRRFESSRPDALKLIGVSGYFARAAAVRCTR